MIFNCPVPESVRFMGFTWSVRLVENLQDTDGEKLDGHIMYGPMIIEIEKSLGYQTQWQVLMHEVIHGYNTMSGHSNESEEQVDRMAYLFIGFAQDNWNAITASRPEQIV